jgi:Cns1/TTC4 Wheel domain
MPRLAGTRKPRLDANGVVWPAMLIYPESMQNDAIEAFHEHHALSDHLDAMFGKSLTSPSAVCATSYGTDNQHHKTLRKYSP